MAYNLIGICGERSLSCVMLFQWSYVKFSHVGRYIARASQGNASTHAQPVTKSLYGLKGAP